MGCLAAILLAAVGNDSLAHNATSTRPNVLLIVIDDLNTDLGCYGHPSVQTPHIDRLASRGIVFQHAYCQGPVCNSSRASIFSGLRPHTTGVLDNETPWPVTLPAPGYLPQHFRARGYFTATFGKILDHKRVPDQPFWDVEVPEWDKHPSDSQILRRGDFFRDSGGSMYWAQLKGPDAATPDGSIARQAAELMRERAATEEPFLIAVGFRRPHTPYAAPAKYFERYRPEEMAVPEVPLGYRDTLPPGAKQEFSAFRGDDEEARAALHAYHACISFVDAQAGVLFDALDHLRLWDNTVVVLLSDHGYHTGHQGKWHKGWLFEQTTRSPLIIAAPHRAAGRCPRIVELLDIYPTLCALGGEVPPDALAGESLAGLLDNPVGPWDRAAVTSVRCLDQENRPVYLGHSLRTSDFRYTQWDEGRQGTELYDMRRDPPGNQNLSADSRMAGTQARLQAQLRVALKSEVDPPPGESSCQLTLQLVESRSDSPVHGLVRITDDATGKIVPGDRALERPMGWFATPPQTVWTVPQSVLRVEACAGIETEVATTKLDLRSQPRSTCSVPLRRFYDPAGQGLVAGNTHLHLMLAAHRKLGVELRSRSEADQYLRVVSQADGLDLVYVSYLTRPDTHYVTNDYTAADFAALSDSHVRFAGGEEYRHDGGQDSPEGRFSYGHVMLLDLPQRVEPASIGPGLTPARNATDAVPLRAGIAQVQDAGGTVLWCHGNMGTEAIPNWLAGLVDAQNIYDGGSEGTIEEVYYPYLNAGLRVPFSTGTDWGIWDFSRAYVPLDRPVRSGAFLAALAAGRSYITNGPFLEFRVDGRRSGETVALTEPRSVRVAARSVGREDFGELQIVFNGQIIATQASSKTERHFQAQLDRTLTIDQPGWLAARIPPPPQYDIRARLTGHGANLLGKPLFAHTSPVYLTLDGRSVFQLEAAEQLISRLQTSLQQIQRTGVFESPGARRQVLALYQDAILDLAKRIELHEAP
jgi:uncharacterized sulfatase